MNRNCSTCEFNFGDVCAGYGKMKDKYERTYGMSIDDTSKMFPNGCSDYGVSLDYFIKKTNLTESKFND